MAGSGESLLDFDGALTVVTLNAPDRRNALTPQMATEVIEALDEVDAWSHVGALVVRAAGESFYAGGDIATFTKAEEDPAHVENYEGMSKITTPFAGSARFRCRPLQRCVDRLLGPG